MALKESYDPEFFSRLFSIEDAHFWFRARNEIIKAASVPIVAKLQPGYRVLEVGCGTGNVLRHLEQICVNGSVIGMDLFFEGLQFAAKRVTCRLIQGDIHASPFGSQFDLIGLFDVLEHLEDDCDMLLSLHKMLKPGEALIITVPAHMSLWSYFDTAAKHKRRYSISELSRKLTQTGYQIDYISQYMAIAFLPVWLGRKLTTLMEHLMRRTKLNQRARELTMRELRITPVFNNIMYWMLVQEARLIALKHRIPIGTSIIAIAQRGS
jgi:SAM-dependent methyltransferase